MLANLAPLRKLKSELKVGILILIWKALFLRFRCEMSVLSETLLQVCTVVLHDSVLPVIILEELNVMFLFEYII